MKLIFRAILALAIYCPVFPASAQWCTVTDTSGLVQQVAPGTGKATARAGISVPIVFNILYKNEEENISDNQILSQLDVLNEDYSASNPDLQQLPEQWRSIAGNAGIHFCLYCQENGQPGIRRKQINRQRYGDLFSVFHDNAGGMDAIDPQQALNVWVVRLDGQLLGFANPVHEYGPSESGVVIDYRHLGRLGKAMDNLPFNLGRTLTHEIGHYFGLLHVWGNYAGECLEDDLVDDTPLQSEPLYGCPGRVSGCETEANVNNFMNLVDDRCLTMFTAGQVDRMHGYIERFLPELSNSTYCNMGSVQYQRVSEAKMMLFPNPNNGAFAVQNATEQDVQVTIFDLAGRLVFSDNTHDVFHLFDLSRMLSGGAYVVVMSNQNETRASRMVIVH